MDGIEVSVLRGFSAFPSRLATCWLAGVVLATVVSTSLHAAPVSDADRDYWAFKPLERPEVPGARANVTLRPDRPDPGFP